MGVVVFAALGITVMSLVVDIVYTYLDPRVRFA
jgi:ABC-type dipeptide/oligopeptide/nickel transport system permease component